MSSLSGYKELYHRVFQTFKSAQETVTVASILDKAHNINYRSKIGSIMVVEFIGGNYSLSR
jgi:hypothetical protein